MSTRNFRVKQESVLEISVLGEELERGLCDIVVLNERTFAKVKQTNQRDLVVLSSKPDLCKELGLVHIRSTRWLKTDFPFKRKFLQPRALFANLANNIPGILWSSAPVNQRLHNMPLVLDKMPAPMLIVPSNSYELAASLNDYFCEHVRLQASVKGNLSPLDFYLNNKHKILGSVDPLLDPAMARELVWYSQIKEASLFNAAVAKEIYTFFKSEHVLDPSAGWGDRLLGAAAAGVRSYHGVDPNRNMQEVYAEIIDFVGDQKCVISADVQSTGFLEAKVPVNTYDTIFTSPPFFDYESYSDDMHQSIKNFTTLESWTKNFMLPYCSKAYRALTDDGVFVLHMSDTSAGSYMKPIVKHMTSLGATFHGVIGVSSTSLVPIWIFSKGSPRFMYKTQPQKMLSSNPKDYKITVSRAASEEVEPPILERKFQSKEMTFTVLDDSVLVGGSKQRLANRIFEEIKEDEIVYAGPNTGFAQIAFAYVAKLYNKKFTMFLPQYRSAKQTSLTKEAIQYGANIKYIRPGKVLRLTMAQQDAASYAAKVGAFLFEFGGRGSQHIADVYELALKDAVRLIQTPPKRLWLTAGSGFTLTILQKIWPETSFHVVQVGKSVSTYIRENDKLYVAVERFWERTHAVPPYDSLLEYDAKLWSYFSAFAEDGDYIWNIGGNR